MKKILSILVPAMVSAFLLIGNVYASEEVAEVYEILAADVEEAYAGGIITDQTGDFVSIFVSGNNLNMETVKPVFYDEEGNVISGEVKASEVTDEGVYFRVEKLTSDSWNLKDDEDGKKEYIVQVEAAGATEVVDHRTVKTVEITRRDIYYHLHDFYRYEITVWLAADLNISEENTPILHFERDYDDYIYEKDYSGEIEKSVNPLTESEETKAIFKFTSSELSGIRDDLGYSYTLLIRDGEEVIMTFPNRLGNLFDNQGGPLGVLDANRDNVFYLPYWIGGAHLIDSSVTPEEEALDIWNYYLTEEDMKQLGNQMYSMVSYLPGEVSEANSDYSGTRLRYEYYFWEALKLPDKPVGKPELILEKLDKDHVSLKWTKAEGVTEYRICVQKPDDERIRQVDSTTELSYVFDLTILSKFFKEDTGEFLFSVIPVAEDGEHLVYGERSESILYMVLPQIEGVTVKGYSANYDGKAHTVTVNGLSEGLKITYSTSESGEYTTTKPKRTKVGVTKVYYKVEKNNYETLTGMVKIIIRPKSTTKVTTSLYKYNAVKVKWNKVSGASGYAVYYKKNSEKDYKLLKRTTALSVQKASLNAGIKYNFKIVPYVTVDGTRYLSNGYKTNSIYTLKKISVPTVSRKSSSKVRVKWTDINGERGYQISRSTSSSKTNIVATFTTPKSIYKDISATKGKTYYYKVRAYVTVDGEKIFGPWSNVKKYKITK